MSANRPRRFPAAVLALALAGCGATPSEQACGVAHQVEPGMTQFQVQSLLGKPWKFSEELTGSLWRWRFKKPGWVDYTFFPAVITVVGVPAYLVTKSIYATKEVHVWFDPRGRAETSYVANKGGRVLDECHEGAPTGRSRFGASSD